MLRTCISMPCSWALVAKSAAKALSLSTSSRLGLAPNLPIMVWNFAQTSLGSLLLMGKVYVFLSKTLVTTSAWLWPSLFFLEYCFKSIKSACHLSCSPAVAM